EHSSVRDDLERQVTEKDKEHAVVYAELEDLRREMAANKGAVADIEALREQSAKEIASTKASHEEMLNAERTRNEEQISKAMRQAAALDGKLDSQRELLRETNQALRRSEEAEARLAAELAEKASQLDAQGSAAREELEAALAKAQREAEADNARFAQQLESAEVMARRDAATEVDTAQRLEAEV
ncbi:unnamed protein product, partial [Prorocentrum cordatum]